MSRLILTFLAFALSALSLSAQTPYLGTGRAFLPALAHNTRLLVYESEITDVKVGDIVARQLGVYLIGTRAIRRTPDGWITRADSASADDPGMMDEHSYIGKVYPDLSRADGRAPYGPIVHDLYVLTPIRQVAQVREVAFDIERPNPIDDPLPTPVSQVPDGGAFGAFALTLVAMCAVRRIERFRA